MFEQSDVMDGVAQKVRVALENVDLSAFSDLLDANVHWGAPDDPSPGCQNRSQVLAWYKRGGDAGVRASVIEVLVVGDRLLVGLNLVGNQAAEDRGGETERWQVLTVHGGRITDIVGFDDRTEAAARARVPGP